MKIACTKLSSGKKSKTSLFFVCLPLNKHKLTKNLKILELIIYGTLMHVIKVVY